MCGLVIINGYPNAEKFIRQGERIRAALQAEGVDVDLVKNGEITACVREDGRVDCTFAQGYDFAVYLDKDKYLGKMLESIGLRLFNSATAVEICDDKLSTYLALGNCGLRLAKSIPAPLCYTKTALPSPAFLDNVAQNLGFPLVAKKSFGSFGAGVRLVHGMPELLETETEWLREPHFYQQYVPLSYGKDYRIIVIGGKAVGSMQRVAQEGEFRSNIELGGVGQKVELDEAYLRAAELAAKTLGLDYCGVDLLETDMGPVVCEVNSNAFFDGFEAVTGLDVAALYARFIVQTMKGEICTPNK